MSTTTGDTYDMGDDHDKSLIRRFTDELEGSTALEVETKAAQIQQDRDDEEAERRRIQKLQDSFDPPDEDRCFDVARIARDELEKVCNRFAQEQKPTLRSRLGISKDHKSAKMKANEKLRSSLGSTGIKDLQAIVDESKTQWKSNQGVIYKNFHRVCGTLEAHTKLFAIFPSENIYTGVLCGTLTCIVQASANHSNVAETLSEAVADITDKVATCASYLYVINTPEMKTRLAAAYSHLFTFYRDTLEWYMQSSMSKVFSSFNAKVQARFQASLRAIESEVAQIDQFARVGVSAMTRLIYEDVRDMKAETFRQRQVHRDTSEIDVGVQMMKHLKTIITSVVSEQFSLHLQQRPQLVDSELPLVDSRLLEQPSVATREDAIVYSLHLESYIYGSEGHSLIHGSKFPPVEYTVRRKLEDWLLNQKLQNLWISATHEYDSTSSARAAAMGVVASAWQAELPILSYFCKRPPNNAAPKSASLEEVGLLGLVYSLIRQLLQFKVPETMIDLSEKRFESLSEDPESSWEEACSILQELLEQTPGIRYCVIDGLNDLEWRDGIDRGNEVLDLLFDYQAIAGPSFQMLLTTSGQSRLLARRIPFAERCIALQPGRRLVAEGRSAVFTLVGEGGNEDEKED